MMDYAAAIRAHTERLRDTIRTLHRRSAIEGEEKLAIEAPMEEADTALEELQVSEEELRHQNDELVEVQRELTGEHERYRNLFDFAPDAYLVTDGAGIIREANVAATRLLGVARRGLVGKPLVLFVAEPDRRILHSLTSSLPTRGRISEVDLLAQPRKGDPVPVTISASIQPSTEGEILWLIRDTTLRRHLEEQAVSLQEERVARVAAEAGNQAKADFLAVVSHELRTPLTSVVAYTELLEAGIPDPLPDSLRPHAERIKMSAHHLTDLIEQILAYSRVEAKKEVPRIERVDVHGIATEAATLVEPLAQRAALSFNVTLPGSPWAVHTDAGKLRQILVNLLSNAVKFTDEGEVRLDVTCEEGWALFRVSDTGIGIPEEEQEKVFEPFWQSQRGNTREYGGTGLGLAVARQLARMLGGNIELLSEPGAGSTFTVRMPLAEPAED